MPLSTKKTALHWVTCSMQSLKVDIFFVDNWCLRRSLNTCSRTVSSPLRPVATIPDVRLVKSANYNGEYIEVKVQIFSIQENPITLWAAGERRWFEIDPSEPFEDMYR